MSDVPEYPYAVNFSARSHRKHGDPAALSTILGAVLSEKKDFVSTGVTGGENDTVHFLVKSLDAYRALLTKVSDVLSDVQIDNRRLIELNSPRVVLIEQASKVIEASRRRAKLIFTSPRILHFAENL